MIDPCKNKNLLSALADGELPADQAEAVRRHLDNCPLCRKDFENLEHTDDLIRHMPSPALSADFDRRFWNRVAEMDERRSTWQGLRFWFTGWRPLVASGLAAGLVAMMTLFFARNTDITPEDLFIAEHIELLDNIDVIEKLDMLEQWDEIAGMKEPS